MPTTMTRQSVRQFITERLELSGNLEPTDQVVEAILDHAASLPTKAEAITFLSEGSGLAVRVAEIRCAIRDSIEAEARRAADDSARRDASGASIPADYQGLDGEPRPILVPGLLSRDWLAQPFDDKAFTMTLGVRTIYTRGSAPREVWESYLLHAKAHEAKWSENVDEAKFVLNVFDTTGAACLNDVEEIDCHLAPLSGFTLEAPPE